LPPTGHQQAKQFTRDNFVGVQKGNLLRWTWYVSLVCISGHCATIFLVLNCSAKAKGRQTMCVWGERDTVGHLLRAAASSVVTAGSTSQLSLVALFFFFFLSDPFINPTISISFPQTHQSNKSNFLPPSPFLSFFLPLFTHCISWCLVSFHPKKKSILSIHRTHFRPFSYLAVWRAPSRTGLNSFPTQFLLWPCLFFFYPTEKKASNFT
jgi:hypothetical protein